MKKNSNINTDEQLKILKNILTLIAEGKIDISEHGISLESVQKCNHWLGQTKGVKYAILNGNIEELSKTHSELEAKKNGLLDEIGDTDTENTLECQKAQLEKDINSCNADIEKLKQQKNTLLTEVKNFTSDKNNIVSEIGDTETENTLEYRKAELEQEIEGLCSQKQTVQAELTSFIADKKIEKENIIAKSNEEFKKHKEEIAHKIKVENDKFEKRKKEIAKEVKTIQRFHDFTLETNKNMRIYFWSALGLIVIAGGALFFGWSNFGKAFEIYEKNINGATIGTMLANSGSLFILKLPLALVLITFIAGFYKLLKSILLTYEKINRDKRNASAIYALMDTLNEQSAAIVASEEIDWNSDEAVHQLKERIKWDKVSKYFAHLYKDTSSNTNNEENSVKEKSKEVDYAGIIDNITALIEKVKK